MPYVEGLTKDVVLNATIGIQEVPKKMSSKVRELRQVFQQENIGRLNSFHLIHRALEVAIGEKIPVGDLSPMPRPFAAIVLTSNPNSHNYPIGEVIIHSGSQHICFKKDGTIGNHAPLDMRPAWRYATREEIDKEFGPGTVARAIKKAKKGPRKRSKPSALKMRGR